MKDPALRGASAMLWASLGLLVLVLCALPLLFERVEEPTDFGPSGMARANPYRGLELVLGELGVQADSRYGLGQLPPQDAVLVLLVQDPDQREILTGRLQDWVADGGHLVVAGAWAWLPSVGDSGEEAVTGRVPDLELDDALFYRTLPPDGPVQDVVHSQDEKARQIAPVPDYGVGSEQPEDLAWAMDSGLVFALRSPVERGLITVVASADFLDNGHLGQVDNALLATDLLSRDGRLPDRAVLVIAGESQSFPALVWRVAAPLVLSGLVLLVLAGWRGAVRAAPLLPAPAAIRRDLLEHVAASGTFLWRHDARDALLAGGRAALRRRLGRLEAPSEGEDPAAQEARLLDPLLAQGHDRAALRAALLDPAPSSAAAFVAVVRTLQQLWSAR